MAGRRAGGAAGWVREITFEEAIGLLSTGEATELSVDHGLGLEGVEAQRTGYTVLVWLEREVAEGRRWSPLIETSPTHAPTVCEGSTRIR